MNDDVSHAERLRRRRADLANKQIDLSVLVRKLQRAHDNDHYVLAKQLALQVARLRDEIRAGRRLLAEIESEVSDE